MIMVTIKHEMPAAVSEAGQSQDHEDPRLSDVLGDAATWNMQGEGRSCADWVTLPAPLPNDAGPQVQEYQKELLSIEETGTGGGEDTRVDDGTVLRDYHMQLLLLEQQNRKWEMMAELEASSPERSGDVLAPSEARTDSEMRLKLLDQQNRRRAMGAEPQVGLVAEPWNPAVGFAATGGIRTETAAERADYEMQLVLLEEQNRKRLATSRKVINSSNSVGGSSRMRSRRIRRSRTKSESEDEKLQLKLLEENSKKRSMMAKQEAETLESSASRSGHADPAASHADCEMQPALLEEQNRERLLMARPDTEPLNISMGVSAADTNSAAWLPDLQMQLMLLEQQGNERMAMAGQGINYTLHSQTPSELSGGATMLPEQEDTKQIYLPIRQQQQQQQAEQTTEEKEEELVLTPEEKAQILLQRRQAAGRVNAAAFHRRLGYHALEDYEWQLNALEERSKAQDKIGDERVWRAQAELSGKGKERAQGF